jgi:hypothetical protein
MLNDQDSASRPHNANRLREDDLHKARVLVDIQRERDGRVGGFDGREVHDPALGLRDNLLRNDKHISGARSDAVPREGRGNEFNQVIAGPDQGQALNGNDLERGHALLGV